MLARKQIPLAHSISPATEGILSAPVGAVLWQLAAPNVVAVAMMTGLTFADAWYISQLGTAALASAALVFPFLTLMQMTAGGAIGGGVTSGVARAFGAGDLAKAEAVAWHAMLIAAGLSTFYMLLLGLFARPIFALLGGEGAALDGAVQYAQIVFGGAAATWFVFVVSAIHRGTGDTATPGRTITIAAAAQIALSGALTLGWFGLPAMGIQGTAAAWVVCQGVAAIYLTSYLMLGKGRIRLRPRAPAWAPFADIMRVGGLGLLNSLCMAMNVAAVTGYVGQYGTAALAGYGLGGRLELMLVPIAFGVGAALTAAVGVNIGAGQYARARRFAWAGACVTLIGTGLIGLIAAFFPSLWLGAFTADPEAYAFGVEYLMIAAPFYGIFAAGQTLYFASQGTGRMILPVTVTVLRFLTVAAFGALVTFMDWHIAWLFVAVAIGLVIMGVGQAACLLAPGWRAWEPRPAKASTEPPAASKQVKAYRFSNAATAELLWPQPKLLTMDLRWKPLRNRPARRTTMA